MQQEPAVNLDLAIEHGLNEEEYNKILDIMQRVPTYTELGIFSVMWSEHCSYKNSLRLLKTLPNTGPQLLVGAGEENAGLIDIGDGMAVAFKIESHNHPSAVEPYQGAATGVGGIMRDIFTMGARPVAALNSLRFGEPTEMHNRWLLDGVVRGIGDYGNCLGIPTVAGEVYFEDCYSDNCLVNAMTVGLVKSDRIAKAIARTPGAKVYAIGSATGRDGIHGATFASEELSEESEEKRSSVQVGDPFTEKLLLEATLELIKKDIVEGIQDMGAAGLTSSTAEISAKSELGIELNLDQIHLREDNMIPYEILLSESQERMLAICRPGKEQEFETVCAKWDLDYRQIGRIIDEKNMRVIFEGKIVADIPSWHLSAGDGAPVYVREARRPDYLDEIQVLNVDDLSQPQDLDAALLKIIASPNIASKKWVYRQYDYMVRTNTVIEPGADAAVVRIKGSKKALAMKTDCNGRYVYLSPRTGTKIAVAEAARNVVASGGQPVAVTNCLNFGNPYKPDIYWQFEEAIGGMSEACIALNTPVTGGNVSFYNESERFRTYPTPVIGMIGVLENVDHATRSHFKNDGDRIYVIGETLPEIGGSEYLKTIHKKVAGMPPEIDLKREQSAQEAVLSAIQAGLINSAHDVADGGLAVALAECCIQNEGHSVGATISVASDLRPDLFLFSESQSRFVVSVSADHAKNLESILTSHKVPFFAVGTVGGDELLINDWIKIPVQKLADEYYAALPRLMARD